MSEELLKRKDENAIATLTLNSPNSLNALSNEMLDCLQSELDNLKIDKKIRVIIIKGSGKAFCAGHDLKEMTLSRQDEDGGKSAFKALATTCNCAGSWNCNRRWLPTCSFMRFGSGCRRNKIWG